MGDSIKLDVDPATCDASFLIICQSTALIPLQSPPTAVNVGNCALKNPSPLGWGPIDILSSGSIGIIST